jgi:hypothetical protein
MNLENLIAFVVNFMKYFQNMLNAI